MRILIGQPFHESGTKELTRLMDKYKNINLVLFPEGYLSSENALNDACVLAKSKRVVVVSSFTDSIDRKNRAIIIESDGSIILNRKKSATNDSLIEPSRVKTSLGVIGFLLCREIFIQSISFVNCDLIVNPIGVGMVSEDQFVDWSSRAQNIARSMKCAIIGTSHADGCFKGSVVSIPISFCYDKYGKEVVLSKADMYPKIVDLLL